VRDLAGRAPISALSVFVAKVTWLRAARASSPSANNEAPMAGNENRISSSCPLRRFQAGSAAVYPASAVRFGAIVIVAFFLAKK